MPNIQQWWFYYVVAESIAFTHDRDHPTTADILNAITSVKRWNDQRISMGLPPYQNM